MSNDPMLEGLVVPPHATCGGCWYCRKVDGMADDPFEFVQEEAMYRKLREEYGLCEQPGEVPVVVGLDLSAHDIECPCSGDGWRPREVAW